LWPSSRTVKDQTCLFTLTHQRGYHKKAGKITTGALLNHREQQQA
jgi:hypothetical protein